MLSTETSSSKVPMSRSEVKFWLSELTASEKFQKDQWLNKYEFENIIHYFETFQKTLARKSSKPVVLDEISSGVLSIISTVAYQNPTVSIEAKRPEAEGMVEPPLEFILQNPDFVPFSLSELMEGSLKYLMDTSDFKGELQVCAFDLLSAGFVALEINHKSTPLYVPNEQADTTRQSGFMDDVTKFVRDPLGMNPENTLSTEMSPEETEQKIERESKNFYGYEDKTYFKRWNPRHILFDSKAEVFKESRFIAKKIFMSIAEFKSKYPEYKNKVPSGSLVTLPYGEEKPEEQKKAVCCYEVQHRTFDGLHIFVVADGIEESLDSYMSPIKTTNFLIKYGSLDKYGKIYPCPRMYRAKHAQDMKNYLASIQMEYADRCQRKIAVDETNLTDQGKNQIVSGDVYALVMKKSAAPIFESMPIEPVSVDNQVLQGQFTESINKAIGTSELAKSGKSESEFATQDVIKQKIMQVNTGQMQDSLGDLSNEALDTAKDIVMQLWDNEMFFKVTGKKGGIFWYRPEMGPIADLMKGDFLVKANITSAMKPDLTQDRMDDIAFFQFLIAQSAFLASKGKTISLTPIESVIKSFKQNPDQVLEDMAPMLPPVSPGGPPPSMGAMPQEQLEAPIGA